MPVSAARVLIFTRCIREVQVNALPLLIGFGTRYKQRVLIDMLDIDSDDLTNPQQSANLQFQVITMGFTINAPCLSFAKLLIITAHKKLRQKKLDKQFFYRLQLGNAIYDIESQFQQVRLQLTARLHF